MAKKTIAIVGGGFAGVACGRRLRRLMSTEEAHIVVFSEENYMVFQPLLAEVAGSSIQAEVPATPLRVALPDVECRREKVIDIHLPENTLVFESFDGLKRTLKYDHVIIACGSGVNLSAVPGMADHAFPFRTVADAVALRAQISQQLEQAAVCEDPVRREFFLTFAVIGGGFSGVEVAGEINDLLQASEKYYPTIKPEESQVILIHSREQLLPEVSSTLRDFTKKKMEQNGVKIVLKQRVKMVTADGVTLSDGTHFHAATVVGTTGTAPHPFVERMKAEKDKGRLKTQPDMRLLGYENAWAIGDCALVLNSFDNEPSPPTGQFAERQGKQCAANLFALLQGKPTKPFYFKPLGMLCAIGGHNAVAEMMGVKLSGFIAWFIWRTVYLLKIPSFSRKVKVALDWTWELMFSRDITGVKIDHANRVHDAYFEAGSFIFKKGDPATDFYVIEKGEVEVMRQIEDGQEPEMVAMFGPGDFFGEMALVEDRPRNASVRARTDVELTIIGKGMFAKMSKILAPLSQQVNNAIRKRTTMRQKLPRSSDILKHSVLKDVIEPLPSQPLSENCTFTSAVGQFEREKADFFCVVDEKANLSGVLTRTDLLSTLEMIAAMPEEERGKIKVKDIMTQNPIWVTVDDSPLLVTEMMRERSMKRMPVVYDINDRRIAGYIRLESLMALVMRKIQAERDALREVN
ncbi:FAD-dependent oxidoreductase [Bryobacter aggregatus]|uniref:FAD-dependent oxidoreductase n=1 Tax=Bryobacter aggregatus TaxID=360054 RepID=UPI00068D405F|nr:FAD-dependent oxidoreductase [Bryobacter aggregatus]